MGSKVSMLGRGTWAGISNNEAHPRFLKDLVLESNVGPLFKMEKNSSFLLSDYKVMHAW